MTPSHVSIETVEIVNTLPVLDIIEEEESR